MEEALADLRLEDDEGSEEGYGWEFDQEQEAIKDNLDLYLVGCFLTVTFVNLPSMKTCWLISGIFWEESLSQILGKRDFFFDFTTKRI